jgi:signal transduction histidine kinase
MSVGMQGRSLDPKRGAATAIAEAQANLERAVEELDRLPALDLHSIALAAHALNNFLTVSGGVVELLIPALRSYPDRQVAIWLEGLSHATDLMSHTVSQLMNTSVGIETGLRLEEVDVARLVERACAYYRRAADAKGIDVKFHAAGDVPIVETDRVLVAAIMDNFLSNAVKYSPRDKRIWVDVEHDRGGVACRVRDEGPGLSPADQERLFLPGVRLGPVPSGGEASQGYGLAIAKRFADQLTGEITCMSTPGRGATFSLWLPGIRPRERR